MLPECTNPQKPTVIRLAWKSPSPLCRVDIRLFCRECTSPYELVGCPAGT